MLLTAAQRDDAVKAVTAKREQAARKAKDFTERAGVWSKAVEDFDAELDNLRSMKVRGDGAQATLPGTTS